MLRSLLSAVSGLQSHQLQIDVIGNNIANLNTIGFKSGRVTFQELMAQTLRGGTRPTAASGGTNPMQIGLGASIGSVDAFFNQGQLLTTGRTTDLAIEGDGFFLLGAGEARGYTRSGSFSIGADGRLVAPNGYVVQGYLADDSGVIGVGGTVSDVVVPLGRVAPPAATTRMGIEGNLDAGQVPLGTIAGSRQLLATAQGSDSLSSLRSSSGTRAGLDDGSELILTANATATTLVTDLSNLDGDAVELVDGMSLTVQDGTTLGTLVFDATWTWSDFAAQIESTLAAMGTETDITVDVQSDGSLLFTNPVGGTNQDVTVTVSHSATPAFNRIISSVAVPNGGALGNSGRALYRRELVAGVDFTTMDALAADIESELQHVSAGATVTLTDGVFTVANAGPSDLYAFSVVEEGTAGPFTDTLNLEQVDIASGASRASNQFLDVAAETDRLIDLHNLAGTALGLGAGELFQVQGEIAGTPIAPVSIMVTPTMTLADLNAQLASILSIDTSGSVSVNPGGQIIISGDPGLDEALTGITISQTSNPVLNAALLFSQTQAATDVVHATSLEAYDSLGSTHVVTLTFTKVPDAMNEWRWEATVDGTATALAGNQGLATFDGDGALLTFSADDGNPFRFDPGNGATSPVAIDFDPFSGGGLGALTQGDFTSNAAISTRDGHAMGFLDLIDIGPDGIINGVFTNGMTQALAQIVLVHFTNPSGLLRTQDGLFVETASSGTPVIGTAGIEMGRTISAGALEASNVDLATELATMIAAQRGFQANARTITTSDEMLAEVINLKR